MMRLLSAAIVVFWLTMTTLLIRTEMQPQGSALRKVPIEHVLKLLFLHQQSSDLSIYSDGIRLGHLQVHPKLVRDTGARRLDFSGNILVRVPDAPRQRFSWDGFFHMDKAFALQEVLLRVNMHDAGYRAEIRVRPGENEAVFHLAAGDRVVQRSVYSLDEKGLQQLIQQQGLDPAMLQAISGKALSVQPTITAQQSSMHIRKERLETYLVSIQQSGQTLLDMHVSQLGGILRVQTFFGYKLEPNDALP